MTAHLIALTAAAAAAAPKMIAFPFRNPHAFFRGVHYKYPLFCMGVKHGYSH